MEIISGIASITQLSRYALSLIATVSEIYKNIQDGPTLQHQRIRQLDRLFFTVQTIDESCALDNASIKEHLKAIIAKIQDLRLILDKRIAQQVGRPIKKYIDALVKDNREEHRILQVFIDLEKDKSALLLGIAETHTALSVRIYNELTDRLPSTQATQTQMPLMQKKALVRDRQAKGNPASSSVNESSIAKIPGSQDRDLDKNHLRANEIQSDAKQGNPQAEGFIAITFPKNDLPNASETSQKATGHVYESITFKGNANIHCGNIGESKHVADGSQKHQYKKIEAEDGRAVFGDAYGDEYTDKFFGVKK